MRIPAVANECLAEECEFDKFRSFDSASAMEENRVGKYVDDDDNLQFVRANSGDFIKVSTPRSVIRGASTV